ncbi:hypothetical protein Sango_0797300 [Sesamum angolense]|uniref:Endonuclease/exonuclease/phosphatase domain-containing protein n=1 Tax=Sesamum angolense TaxID=2727404 RepID=A0AAE1X2S6_9LAMI|nr:hypothetical protein Sango_0797300 [Sesamum angolense]
MKIFCWNCQGLGSSWTVRSLGDYVRLHNPSLVFISETKLSTKRCEKIKERLNMLDVGVNSKGQPETLRRKESWDLLLRLEGQSVRPWLAAGDFNEILHHHEKDRQQQQPIWQIENIWTCLSDCNFVDLGFEGDQFTWCNRREQPAIVSETLDRAICSSSWASIFPHCRVSHIRRIFIRQFWIIFTPFFDLLSLNPHKVDEILEVLELQVTKEVNEDLLRPYIVEEVKSTLNQMYHFKSLGPNDDTLVFCKAIIDAMLCIDRILNNFEATSTLKTNLDKSATSFSKNIPLPVREELAAQIGVLVVENHDKYLGLPSIVGRTKREVFVSLKDWVWTKIQGWSAR